MPRAKFEPCDLDDVPKEDLRNVIGALMVRLGLKLESRQADYSDTQYRFVGEYDAALIKALST